MVDGGQLGGLLDVSALAVLGGPAIAALGLGIAAGLIKADGTWWKRGMEAMLLAFLGGLAARTFVTLVMALGSYSPEVGWVIAWAIFIWPGVIETVARLFDAQPLSSLESLQWIATGIGSFTGMMAGIWRIHPVNRKGAIQLLLDTTWGLPGATNGALLHLVNFAWAGHGEETRNGAHRYEKGFRIKENFAFTQGPVMSELDVQPGDSLYQHELVHVSQNRAFGPLFVVSYVVWMACMAFPALIGSIWKGKPSERLQGYCYFSNPWEAWGYKVQEQHGGGARTDHAYPMWSDQTVRAISAIFFPAVSGFLLTSALLIWT
jgi:hypothetical protein